MSPFTLPILPIALLAGTPSAPPERTLLAMGTTLRLQAEGSAKGMEPALAAVAALEARCSTWRPDSTWSRLNAGESVTLSMEDQKLLRRVADLARDTGGCFDPLLGRLIQAWGLRTGGRVPSAAELAEARMASGLSHLEEASEGLRLTGGAWIEEGGFLKGYALDVLRNRLQAGGALGGLLDFGGQLLAWGPARTVALADPKDRQRPRLALRLRNASLSTSGTSERGRHILDPRTGQPCEGWGSVAVVRPTGLEADVLSTALYVMGPDRGFAWAKARGLAAAFLLNDGTAKLTPSFRALHPRLP
ncbi:MAG TPA: FAD:protein FMN transferase [Holophagaceae bacterium]|nr:FAD:protein FMN transferase [Holophagaceae bacterium]